MIEWDDCYSCFPRRLLWQLLRRPREQTYSVSLSKVATVRYHDGLRPSLSGSLKVNGPPAQVTLTADEPTILFGHSTALNCLVSSKAASEQVTLNQQVAGDKTVAQADQTTTGANGTCSFNVSPTRQTMYTAQWKTTTSPPVTVFVRPLVGFGVKGRIYTAKVTSDISYGGHFVYVQRRNAFGTWVNAKKIFLSSNGSRARFTVKVPKGRSPLRIWLPTSETGAGYVENVSRTLIARR